MLSLFLCHVVDMSSDSARMAASSFSNLRRGKFCTQDHIMDELQSRGSENKPLIPNGSVHEVKEPQTVTLRAGDYFFW